jgi:hypothetical protein
MSGQSETVHLFEGAAMTRLARDVGRKARSPGIWPERIIFDFRSLKFIRPAGVVFIHNINILRWLQAKDCRVVFRGHTENAAPLRYLHTIPHLSDEEEELEW